MQCDIGEQRGENQQGKAGAYSTAFRGDFDIEAGKVKLKTIAQVWDAKAAEEKVCYGCGPRLQPANYRMQNRLRYGDSKEQKAEWKSGFATRVHAVASEKGARQRYQQSEDGQNSCIEGDERQISAETRCVYADPRGEQDESRRCKLYFGKHHASALVNEESRYQWDKPKIG